MVKELRKENRSVYLCELCGMGYADLETAEVCEEYCDAHGSCSIDITRKAIYKPAIHFMPESRSSR